MNGLFKTAGGTQDLVFSFHVAPIAGDYNLNGIVDAADYTVWRDSLGKTGASLAANGDNTGGSANVVDAADLAIWKANFGKVNGAALANAGILTGVVRYVSFAGSGADAAGSPVPEPSSLLLLALGGIAALVVRRHQ
jgi:hypothetical protein